MRDRRYPLLIMPLLLSLLIATCAHADSLSSRASVIAKTPSLTFANRTTLLHEQGTQPDKTEMQAQLPMAVPLAKSGGITFCLPLIIPSLADSSTRGSSSLTLSAQIFRGTF